MKSCGDDARTRRKEVRNVRGWRKVRGYRVVDERVRRCVTVKNAFFARQETSSRVFSNPTGIAFPRGAKPRASTLKRCLGRGSSRRAELVECVVARSARAPRIRGSRRTGTAATSSNASKNAPRCLQVFGNTVRKIGNSAMNATVMPPSHAGTTPSFQMRSMGVATGAALAFAIANVEFEPGARGSARGQNLSRPAGNEK